MTHFTIQRPKFIVNSAFNLIFLTSAYVVYTYISQGKYVPSNFKSVINIFCCVIALQESSLQSNFRGFFLFSSFIFRSFIRIVYISVHKSTF